MSLQLAPNGHAAMSELSLFSGVNRTSRLRLPTSEVDPLRKSATSEDISSDGTFTVFQLFSLLC
jgi:hypothetical protein